MRWRYFNDAGTEVGVDHFVGYHADFERAVDPFDSNRLPYPFLVTLIVRVNGNGRIAKLGFWAGRSQRKGAVLDVVQRSLDIFVDDLDVCETCTVKGTIID